MVEHLWAGWRMPYIRSSPEEHEVDVPDGMTLFEAILHSGLPDDETYILWRGDHCFALLNAYPYTSGHVMVLPQRGVPLLADLTADEHAELWEGVRFATEALTAAYEPQGMNIGANLGRGAGAGFPDHLHVHVLPRWEGDTNFMTSVANVRVLPEALSDSWLRIREAWPVA
ncbi:MAG: HIT domain-containing protein [Acidimicrobiales bacterium]